MRVAIVAESFLPNVNGVTNSVLRIVEYAQEHGHEVLIIAPGGRSLEEEIFSYRGARIVRVPTVMVPRINSLPIGVPGIRVAEAIAQFAPDVIHLASPFVLGAAGAFVANRQHIPAVAVYQTDVAGFAQRYKLAPLAAASWEWTRIIHNMCQCTLAPSSAAIDALKIHGINNIYRWARGVDSVRFHPDKRSMALRTAWDPSGKKKIVGFVGRLAAEKGVHRLAALNKRRDLQVVIVGDGPERADLENKLPNARFLGALGGEELARAYASFDVFVHPGEFETFCQTIQEAHASGVPTIAPRAGGPMDLITQGQNGFLLDVASFEQDLEASVDKLLGAQHATFRRQAREGISQRTWEALCAQLFKHYERVIMQNEQRAPLSKWAQKMLGVS
ncbi:glycosyltransferase family 1 protein [Corynebacterium sp. sy017]|uniref:glycosyltransferase family 4 protein n=1 Tax=unclassified Corynebacterium TaxID=2624378 RepID=UPI0011859BF4|nr:MULTISPECIES: glycosyltransferase family 1 protein [unclassified Corynebacterium]MBP3089291.1 glycosyltransferase family 1 protein [Corynebacterium sp. sy017]TSD91120.1 glycosyltransferase family 1 protein [Corynebacterium sp. SY003]